MEELEGFLMQEDMDILEEFWPPSFHISANNDTSLNMDQFWGMEFPDVAGFESELCSLMSEDEFVIPSCFTGNEEENNGLLEQYIQPEQQREQEQEQERLQEPVVQPFRPLDEEEEEESDDKSRMDSKNLVSERNRRKRLNQQLFTLRTLVPNITRMDKRSILVDAFAYLQSITQQIEREMKKKSLSSAASSNSSCSKALVQEEVQPVLQTTLYERQCAALPALLQVEADVLDEERFLLGIYCNKAVGAIGQVHRSIEMLGLEVTCITMNEFDEETMETAAFLRVKKKGMVTREKLLSRIRLNAKQLGLLIPPAE